MGLGFRFRKYSRHDIPRPLKSLYTSHNLSDRLQKDLNLIILAGSLGMVFVAASGGAAYVGFTNLLGVSDFHYGLLAAVPILGNLMQFVAAWLLEKTHKRRFLMVGLGLFQRALWIPIGIVPWVIPASAYDARIWTIITLILLSSMSSSFVNICFQTYMGDLVPIAIRGRYISLRSSICTAASMVSALIISLILDNIPTESLMLGYTLIFCITALFGVADLITFLFVSDPPLPPLPKKENFFHQFRHALRDKSFMWFVTFWTVWNFTSNLWGGFTSRYITGTLGFSLTTLTIAGTVIGSIALIVGNQKWGELLDRKGPRWVLLWSIGLLGFGHLWWFLLSPTQIWPYVFIAIFTNLVAGGVNIASGQLLLAATPSVNRSFYVATYSVITALMGSSIGSFLGGSILQSLSGFSFTIGSLIIDHYKLVFFAGNLLRTAACMVLIGPMVSHLPEQDESPFVKANLAAKEEK